MSDDKHPLTAAELAEIRRAYDPARRDDLVNEDVLRLLNTIDLLVAELRWYGDTEHHRKYRPPDYGRDSIVDEDSGQRARALLGRMGML